MQGVDSNAFAVSFYTGEHDMTKLPRPPVAAPMKNHAVCSLCWYAERLGKVVDR